jgi:chaperonin GroEL
MSAKQIIRGEKVSSVVLSALEIVVGAVGVTLGPKGRNVLVESSYGAPKVTKDGVTVAKAIAVKDEVVNMVVKLIIQAAEGTVEEAGDGTTTATILTGGFTLPGITNVVAGMDPMGLSRGIKKAVDALVDSLHKLSKPCTDSNAIKQVGTISANGDTAVGNIIAEAMEKVGKNGVITVEKGSNFDHELEVLPGMRIDRGYISPHFVTNRQTGVVELDNPYILIVDKKISNIREILGILEKVAQANRALFIIAEDVEGEALPTLILNNLRGIVKVCAVKAPGFGDRRKEILQDIAILTKATVISEEIGLSLEKIGLENLGGAKRVVVDKESFTIIDGAGDADAVEARVAEITRQQLGVSSEYEKEKLQERLAKLSGGVAVIKVGGATESEVGEKEYLINDALNATRAAVEEGIVPGGGVALLRASKVLETLKGDNSDEDAGIAIVAKGVRAPLFRIVENAGGEAAVIAHELLNSEAGKKNPNYGYDAAKGIYGDMHAMGIIDPTKVARTAVQKASSIARMLLTAQCLIAEFPKEESERAGGMNGGMGGMDMM